MINNNEYNILLLNIKEPLRKRIDNKVLMNYFIK